MSNRRTALASAATLLLGAGLLGAGALPASGDPAASSHQQALVGRTATPVSSLAEAERLLDAAAGRGGETLLFFLVETSAEEVDLEPAGPSAGDLFLFEDQIYTDRARTEAVGFAVTRQQFGGPQSSLFEQTLDVPGGNITVAGAFTPPLYTPSMAIVGGTGLYRDAGGVEILVQFPDGSFANLLRVIR